MSNEHENGQLHALRHSAAHVMAEAVLEMFPEGKIAFGPPIEDGFYYDFDLPRTLTPDDLEEIERRMRDIIAGKYPFVHRDVTIDEAKRLFADQPYKLQQIERLASGTAGEPGEGESTPADVVSLYTHHNFTDLCRGPHVDDTGQIDPQAFKLLKVAGAYWLGDERNPMLQRIYGTVWSTKAELDAYLHKLEEIEKRDHRKLGKQLDLFSTSPHLGAGLILWHPHGAIIRHEIENFWTEEHLKRGYQLVYTPHIASEEIYKISGHLEAYADMMYSPMDIDGHPYRVKPMNCPGHICIFQSSLRSYRDMPLRYAELGTVYRYERSGVLHGMFAGTGFHPGRRPHLLPARPAQGRSEPGVGSDRVHDVLFRLHVQNVPLHPARKVHRHRRAMGIRHQRFARGFGGTGVGLRGG